MKDTSIQVIPRHQITDTLDAPALQTIVFMPWLIVKDVTQESLLNPDVGKLPNVFLVKGNLIQVISSHLTKGAADKAMRKLAKSLPEPQEYPYQIFLTEKQAQVLVDALDLYSRIGAGQLEEIAHILRINPGIQHDKVVAVEDLAKEAADCWMGRAGGHYGIFSEKIHDVFRIAWDLQQVIRYRLAWDRNPNGGIQVNFDDPMQSSKEPLALIKRT